MNSDSTLTETLRSAYCRLNGIQPEKFETRMLRQTLFLHARVAFFFARILHRDAFHPERSLIRQAGDKINQTEVKLDIDFYQHKNVIGSFLRGTLRLRVSGIRLQRIARDIFREAREA